MTDCVSTFLNSQDEKITIERITKGDFKGQLLLCIYDDGDYGTRALHLLDEPTIDWLKKQLNTIKPNTEASS